MVHPVTEAIPVSGTAPAATLRQKLAASGVWPVLTAGAVSGTDLTGLDVIEISLGGQSFIYAALDTTTAHDGVTCLVSSDGKRFKAGGLDWGDAICETRALTAPPGSPTIGLKWLLPAAPTGAWASHGKAIAQWTASGWRFSAPSQGRKAYVKDEDKHLFYDATAAWVEYPARSLAYGMIPPMSLTDPFAIIRVEDARATPPGGMPGTGTAYIVAASPTGAFVGHVGKVARSNGAAYEFIVPGEGSTVYRKDIGALYTYRSGAWGPTTPPAGVQQVKRMTASNEALGSIGTTLVYSAQTAALQSAVGKVLRFSFFEYRYAFGANNTGDAFTIGLYKDSDSVATGPITAVTAPSSSAIILTNPLDPSGRLEFIHTVADNLSHTWKIGVKKTAGLNRTCTLYFDLLIEELQVV